MAGRTAAVPWRQAWATAIYGPDGFWRRAWPADHFRTAAQTGPWLAAALVRLAHRWGHDRIVDVGAGGGELLTQVHRQDPGLRLVGVDVRARPAGLATGVDWVTMTGDDAMGAQVGSRDLVVAAEWLDDIPCEVVEVDAAGRIRTVLVDTGGREELGPEVGPGERRWLDRWWPIGQAPPGTRAEVGDARDRAWARLVTWSGPGASLVAVDYAHLAGARPVGGTLAGYRHGRQVRPAPDGSMNLTAHVALDAVTAAGVRAGARRTHVVDQRTALTSLGVLPAAPPRTLAQADPSTYLAHLARHAQAAQLGDPEGLGGFRWLVQHVPTRGADTV